MTEYHYQPAPPRVLTVPQTPVPQTCFGVLNEQGTPTENVMITDLNPSFDWMAAAELYVKSFTMDFDQAPGTLLSNMCLTEHYGSNPRMLPTDNYGWHHIPFLYSKWWTGFPTIRLMAIKPSHVTGKILITHSPDDTKATDGTEVIPPSKRDPSLRAIKMEWDLGTSSEIVFDVPGFNVIGARPTWIPRTAVVPADKEGTIKTRAFALPVPSFSFGRLFFEVAEGLQPGNIYPSSIRILVFSSFRNSQFFVPTDARHGSRSRVNILGLKFVPNLTVSKVG